MTSRANIFNMALGKIGDTLIDNPDGESAQICRVFYDPSRRELYEEHPWRFAGKQVALALSTETPLFRFDYCYALPGDNIRIRSLSNTLYTWQIRGSKLETDMEDAEAVYTADIEDTTKFPPLFVNALATKLAMEIAATKKPQDGNKIARLAQQLIVIMNKAQAADDRAARLSAPHTVNKFVRDRGSSVVDFDKTAYIQGYAT